MIRIECPASDSLALVTLGEALAAIGRAREVGTDDKHQQWHAFLNANPGAGVPTLVPGEPTPLESCIAAATATEETAPEPPDHDSEGLPWDSRIHSAGKTLNSDGTWRVARRPKDKDESEWAATIQAVRGELKAVENHIARCEQHADIIRNRESDTVVPPPLPVVSSESIVPPPPPSAVVTITDLPSLLMAAVAYNKSHPDATIDLNGIAVKHGAMLGTLTSNPDALKTVCAEVEGIINGTV
jgi:hypothetical protein